MRDCYAGGTCGNEALIEELTRQRDDLVKALEDLVTVFVGSFGETEIAQRVAEGFPVVQNARAATAQTKEDNDADNTSTT